ncbi:hypothetical protein HYDPIDRAFT_27645 [Hydnomerulius pinastri MD-312]|nr:hypothetical protein HYDPIDRAFT_27645 [Hydnomerulius pinastri MD-312]
MTFPTLQGVVRGAVALYCQATWIDSLPLLDDIDGCASSTGEKREFVTWALFIFADAVMLILMLVKLCRHQRQLHNMTGISRLMVLNGVLYFSVLFMLAIPCIALSYINETEYTILSQIATNPTRILHSIFASRIILHIRQELAQTVGGDPFLMSTLEPISFRQRSQVDDTGDTGLSYEDSPHMSTTARSVA